MYIFIYFYVRIRSPHICSPILIPVTMIWLSLIESTLPDNASTQFTAFFGQMFNEKKIFLHIFICKISMILTLWPHPTTGDDYLIKLKSTISEDASSQVWVFLAKCFLKNTKQFEIVPYYFSLKEAVSLHFNKRESFSPNNYLC